MKKACAKLGIPYGRFTSGGLTFHDSRQTFVSTLLGESVDLETTRELAGLSRDMILRYAHSSPENKRRAVSAINGKPEIDQKEIDKKLGKVFREMKKNKLSFKDFKAQILELWSQSGLSIL